MRKPNRPASVPPFRRLFPGVILGRCFAPAASGQVAGPQATSPTTYTYSRQNVGQTFVRPDGFSQARPNNNLWTQPYTLATDLNGNGYVAAYTNWDALTSYPNGSGVTAIVGPQTDPNGNAALNGLHLNDNVSILNLTLSTGALLTVDSSNSGGAGNHAITFTLANSGAGTIQNSGTINIAGTDQTTTVSAANALTLSGTGTLGLGNTAIFTGPGTLTQTAGHTIQGGGNATISVPLVNQSTVTANGFGNFTSGSTLVSNLNVTSPTIANTGTISSTGTGTLDLTGTAITNTGGVIRADGAATGGFFGVVVSGGTSITGGTLTSTGTTYTGNGVFQFEGPATLSNLTLSTGTTARVDYPLALAGTVTNNGNVIVTGFNFNTSTTANLNVAANATLAGTGTVGLASGQVVATNNAVLTQSAGHTIQGGGNATISASLNNQGTITANGFGNFTNGSTLVSNLNVTSPTITNTGTISSTATGTLDLTGTAINNAGGIILADGAATGGFFGVVVSGGTSITGGTLSGTGTNYNGNGVFQFEGPATFSNLTLSAGTTARVDYPLALAGTITNNGSVVITGFNFNTGTTANLNIAAAATLAGSGAVTLLGGEIDATNAAVLTHSAGQTIRGYGTINASVVNNGTIQSAGGTLNVNSLSVSNNGTLEATDGSTLQQGGTSVLTNYAAGSLTGGTYRAASAGNGANLNLNIGAVTTNAANVFLSGANSNFTPINSIAVNAALGGFHVLNGRIFTTAGNLSNAGTVEIGAAGTNPITAASSLTVNGIYAQSAGVTINNGTLTANSFQLTGGTFQGNGTYVGGVTNAGVVSPGNSPGQLKVTGSYAQTAAGSLMIEIAGNAPGTAYDELTITGPATLSGALNVTLLGGYAPLPGTIFDILQSTGRTGAFTTTNAPGFTVSYTPTDVILTAVPEPTSVTLLAVGGLLALGRRARKPLRQ